MVTVSQRNILDMTTNTGVVLVVVTVVIIVLVVVDCMGFSPNCFCMDIVNTYTTPLVC